MPRPYEFITFPVPALDMKGDAYIAREACAAWRLICIPGAPSQKYLFKRLLNLRPKSLEMVVVNRLGYGKSHEQPVLDFNAQAKIIEPFLGEKRTLLLGISYGGAIALTAALNYQDNIEGVITGAALIDEPRQYAKAIVDFENLKVLDPILPRRYQHMREEIKGRRAQIGPLLAKLKGLNIPIEVLHGTLDNVVGKDNAKTLLAAAGDNAHYTEIIGGTHFLETQMPGQILEAVDRVIKRIESSA